MLACDNSDDIHTFSSLHIKLITGCSVDFVFVTEFPLVKYFFVSL